MIAALGYILLNDPNFVEPKAFRPERYLMEDGRTINKVRSEISTNFIFEKNPKFLKRLGMFKHRSESRHLVLLTTDGQTLQ